MTQRTSQPEAVVTQEAQRAPDEHVVTTDAIAQPLASKDSVSAAGKDAKPAAAPSGDANSPDPASGDADNQATDRQRKRSNASRLRKLAAKLSEAEARDAANTQRIRDLEEQVTSLRDATPKPKEPMLQDFRSPAEYARAYAKWESAGAKPPARQPRATPADAPASPPPAQDPPAASPEAQKELQDFHQRGKAKLGDEFMEALTEKTWVNQMAAEYILDSDFGPEIYVHLANNPEEARVIYDYSPVRAGKALAALEAKAKDGKLDVGDGFKEPETDEQDEPEKASKARQTKAPTPPSDIKPAGSGERRSDPSTEGMDDYAARRRKEEARRRGLLV